MNSNVKFNYLYRDAGNYKAWGEVIFINPEERTLDEVETHLRKAFDQDGLFIASQILIPEVFLYIDGRVTDDDHCFHEYDSVEVSNELPNDKEGRSIWRFVEQAEFESSRGWQPFNPFLQAKRTR
jgi:hypothetical protein